MKSRSGTTRFYWRLWSLILVYTPIAAWYSCSLPPGEGIDELAHFAYVRYVAQNHRLPVQGWQNGTIEVVMAYHSPLYYIISAVLIHTLDTSDLYTTLRPNPHFLWSETGQGGWNVMLPVDPTVAEASGSVRAIYRLRGFGILLGVVGLILIYQTTQRLLPDHPWASLGATSLMVLNPSFIYMTVNVHHDVLLAVLFAGGLYWCVHHATHPLRLPALILGGILVGAAILTKLSGLALLPAVTLVLWLRPNHTEDWGTRFAQTIVLGSVALLVCGWWFVRNQVLYGDPVGLKVYLTYYTHNLRTTPFTWGVFVHEFLAQLGRTFWGSFGFMHILLPTTWRRSMWILTSVAFAGYIFIALRKLRASRFSQPQNQLSAAVQGRVVPWIGPLSALASLLVFLVRFAAQTKGAGHGRYLLPCAATLGSILIVGLNGYTRWRHQRLISLLLLTGMATYAVTSAAIHAWPKYTLPDSIAEAELAEATPLGIHYADGVELLAARASAPIVIPGQGMDVTTYWHASQTANEDTDPYIYLSIGPADGPGLGLCTFWPEVATIPSSWGDRVVSKTCSFYIPPSITSGRLHLEVRVRDGKEGEWLPSQDTTSGPITILDLLALGAVQEIKEPDLPTEERSEVFAGTIRLHAVQFPQQLHAGDILPIALYWEVLDTMGKDYTVFVHVLDQNSNLVGQLDRPPGGGTAPTSSWRPSQLLLDTYPVPLPSDLAPGAYQVLIGMYTWPDLTRQAITRDGDYLGDSLIVGSFMVSP